MADAKLSDLTALAGADLATNDLWYVVDVSATTTGSKKMTTAEKMLAFGFTYTLAADNLCGNPTDNTIDANVTRSLISGGGSATYPNKIGAAAKPVATPPVGMSAAWDTDSGYVDGAADVATIGGGYDHVCNQEAGTVVGGGHNFIMYNVDGHSTILGNSYNLINCGRALIAGAYNCSITGTSQYSVICGGKDHAIVGTYSTVVGGNDATVTGSYSAVVGGNTGTITGSWSGILGGVSCSVAGNCGYAFGRRAKTTEHGAVQWADNTDADVTNAVANSFAMRYSGGVRVTTGDLQIDVDKAFYIGPAATDGSWKFVVSGSDLLIQKRVSGSYVTKSTISGA